MSDPQCGEQGVDSQTVEQLLQQALSLTEVYVQSEGSHFTIIAVGECFDGLSRVKQQQAVYKPLKDLIADNSMHAVTIKAFTPQQWTREKKFNLPS